MELISTHYITEHSERQAFINDNIGRGVVVDSFIVDHGHPNGAEIHSVTDTGVIIIQNSSTLKLITELIARPEQLRRLYRSDGREPPKKILGLAYKHNRERYNEK